MHQPLNYQGILEFTKRNQSIKALNKQSTSWSIYCYKILLRSSLKQRLSSEHSFKATNTTIAALLNKMRDDISYQSGVSRKRNAFSSQHLLFPTLKKEGGFLALLSPSWISLGFEESDRGENICSTSLQHILAKVFIISTSKNPTHLSSPW